MPFSFFPRTAQLQTSGQKSQCCHGLAGKWLTTHSSPHIPKDGTVASIPALFCKHHRPDCVGVCVYIYIYMMRIILIIIMIKMSELKIWITNTRKVFLHWKHMKTMKGRNHNLSSWENSRALLLPAAMQGVSRTDTRVWQFWGELMAGKSHLPCQSLQT